MTTIAKPLPYCPTLSRDGTSQSMRRPAALAPDHAPVDERTTADLLAFARDYGKELVYHDDSDKPAGDWGDFLGPAADIDALAALVDAPQGPPGAAAAAALRPHQALFLTFLGLLGHARDQLNTLTRRHLDFYVRGVLGMAPRPPLPDRVNVLVSLARKSEEALVPAGTLLDAGKDSRGADRAYRTDRDVVINRARVERIASIFVERQVETLEGARARNAGDAGAALLAMLSIALGDPSPGDPLQPHGAEPITLALLERLTRLVAFAMNSLHMELHELEDLARLVASRAGEAAEWKEINGYLQGAARLRRGEQAYVFAPARPTDFDANVAAAVGTPSYATFADILDIEDLYQQRGREDVRAFVKSNLHFTDVKDFAAMMQTKLRIDAEWREINRILEVAGQRKRDMDETYRLDPADPEDFAANFAAAVGPVDWSSLTVAGVEAYQKEIERIESTFRMPVADFAFMMAVRSANGPSEKEWSRVVAILGAAHERLVVERRTERLKRLGKAAASPLKGLSALLCDVLGAEQSGEPPPALIERLKDLVPSAAELDFLVKLAADAAASVALRDKDWERAAIIVERARQVKERPEPAIARKVEQLDIHAYEDATAVIASLGIEDDRDNPRWRAFGQARPEPDAGPAPAPVLGWAIHSPLLALREGSRSITLTFGFQRAEFNAARIAAALAQQPFLVEVSTAGGFKAAGTCLWVQGDYGTLSGVAQGAPATLPALQLQITLDAGAEPIAAPVAAGGSPAVRVLLRPLVDAARRRYITLYEPLAGLTLAAVHARVEVNGLRAEALENDRSILDAQKPFEPFGAVPAVGSRFYLGHPEICAKQLDSLRFNVEWMNAPESLAAHYDKYPTVPDPRARVLLRDGRREIELVPGAALFDPANARNPFRIEVASVPAALRAGDPRYGYGRIPGAVTSERRVSQWPRHLVWELTPVDFQHSVYPQIAARKAGELTLAAAKATIAGGTAVDVAAYQVNAPITPLLKRLSIDYTASVELRLDGGAGAAEDGVVHIHPFGACAVTPEPGRGAPLLPRYDRYEGELYLGLGDVRAPQTLSVLFQLAEGSADPDAPRAEVVWSYLSGDAWISLGDGNIIADGTRGLTRTGILELSLDRASPSTRMPAGLYWLRAAVPEGTRAVCDVVAVHAQVVSATFVDRGNAPDHHDAPLPAGSITRALDPVRGVAALLQPYPSAGGRPAEREAGLHARISERLRHKSRGLAVWDYEHLILDRFPEIYRAICLPAGTFEANDQPGRTTIVVIPDIRRRIPFDPFEPKATAETIDAIAAYLADKAPPHARIEVKNAEFTAVKVSILVRFMPGCDEGFHRKKLNEEICRFMSPWAYEGGADITTGNSIFAGSIIDFVDRRPYVDHVAGITLLKRKGAVFEPVPWPKSGGYSVSASRPDGVLVAAREHDIDTSWQYRAELAAAPAVTASKGPIGIGVMRIGLDFVILNLAAPAGVEDMLVGVDFEVG